MKNVILLNSPLKNPEKRFHLFLAWKNSAEKNPSRLSGEIFFFIWETKWNTQLFSK